ncbi:hypothetical protein EV385_6667 [Krasilnikovia cinnamomea]|uniref:Protein RecA n=1 Tax=Krasilnikovia cinnamomea TaxID=349313 RepID=A0A4Q7Z7V0_9ACTN|nr:hypothetical protein [Krasilnikovia cinnamomea]RZU46592.1 hypothetical protein EV385_6667 [Krasilnikovia cinnamomea]
MASAERAWSGAGRITGPADVARVIAEVNAAGLGRDRTAALARSVATADDVQVTGPDASRTLPVLPELTELFPIGGLRRGNVITATGSTSLLMALIAPVVAAGSWAAVAGMPDFGALAAITDYGIASERLALVPAPGPDWPTVVAALLDGFDLVVAAVPGGPPPADRVVRSLAARARQRGSVLILVTDTACPGTDLALQLIDRRWNGLGIGRGRLRHQEVTIRAAGKGNAARARTTTVTLPPSSLAVDPAGPAVDAQPPAPTALPAGPSTPVRQNLDEAVDVPHLRPVPPPVDPWASLVKQVPSARPPRRHDQRS